MNIVVLSAGYVGLSNAILLAQKNNVTLFDINKEKINLINKKNTHKRKKFDVIIYKRTLLTDIFKELTVVNNVENFSTLSNLIIANRYENILQNVREKIYTRNVFMRD